MTDHKPLTAEKCRKPGCGALKCAPCSDRDCPQLIVSWAEHSEALATIDALRAENAQLTAKLSAAEKLSGYWYIGKDGRQVLARTLEDERDALRSQVEALTAERDAALAVSVAVVPEGWVAVPEKATAEMLAAMVGVYDKWTAAIKDAPPAPLMTEAQVRKDERVKALRHAAVLAGNPANGAKRVPGDFRGKAGYLDSRFDAQDAINAEADRLEGKS